MKKSHQFSLFQVFRYKEFRNMEKKIHCRVSCLFRYKKKTPIAIVPSTIPFVKKRRDGRWKKKSEKDITELADFPCMSSMGGSVFSGYLYMKEASSVTRYMYPTASTWYNP
jgi:hypothetical protein